MSEKRAETSETWGMGEECRVWPCVTLVMFVTRYVCLLWPSHVVSQQAPSLIGQWEVSGPLIGWTELSSAWTRLSSVLIWILHISNFILPSVFSWLNQKSKSPNTKSFERLVGRNFIDHRSGSEFICCDISRSLFLRHEAAFLCSADCKGIILWNNGRPRWCQDIRFYYCQCLKTNRLLSLRCRPGPSNVNLTQKKSSAQKKMLAVQGFRRGDHWN